MSWFNVSEFQFSHQDPDLCTIDIPAFIECPKVLGGLQFHWLSCKLVIQLYLFFYCKREGSFHKPSQSSLVLTLSHKLLIVLSLLYSFEGHQYNLESISLCCFYRHCFPPCFQMPEWAHQPQQSPPWEYFPRLLHTTLVREILTNGGITLSQVLSIPPTKQDGVLFISGWRVTKFSVIILLRILSDPSWVQYNLC